MALDANDIKMLTQALSAAIRAQGGEGQRWNAISSRIRDDTGSPEDRAQAIRASKNMEDNNKLSKELASMLANNTRSMSDLKRFTDAHTKVIDKAIHSFDDIDKSTSELTEQLRQQLAHQDANTQTIKKLAGNMSKLEHALSFADLGKHMSDLSRSLDANSRDGADEIINAVELLEDTIRRNGGTDIGDVSVELKNMVDEIRQLNRLTRKATQQDVNLGHAAHVGQDVRDSEQIAQLTAALKSSAKHKNAQDQLRDLSIATQTKGIEASIAVTKKSTGVVAVASKRLDAWSAKVGGAAFVLDQLASAGKMLYNTIKVAGGTGTERSWTGVITRDFKSLINGVNPAVVQEVQQKDARTRSAFGRENFDKSIMDGVSQLVGVTYDRNEALKMKSATISSLSRSGVNADTANMTAASKGLIANFIKLQYLTGLTGEQMAGLTTELAADADYRQGLMTLNGKERAASVAGITQMFQENALRNISIEQTKSMQRAQLALSDATSPKTRMKNAAKLKALGGAVGIDMTDAASLVMASGNKELMKKRLLASGMSAKEADARVANAGASREKLGSMAEKSLSGNDAQGLMMEQLLASTGTKDWALSAGQTLNEAGKMQKDAADKMMEAAMKMADVNPLTNIVDFVGNSLTTITAAVVGAIGLFVAHKLGLGGKVLSALGKVTNAIAPGLASKLGIAGAAGATAAAGAAGAASAIPKAASIASEVGNVGSKYGPAANAADITGAANATIKPVITTVGTVGEVGSKYGPAANTAGAVITPVATTAGTVGNKFGPAANTVNDAIIRPVAVTTSEVGSKFGPAANIAVDAAKPVVTNAANAVVAAKPVVASAGTVGSTFGAAANTVADTVIKPVAANTGNIGSKFGAAANAVGEATIKPAVATAGSVGATFGPAANTAATIKPAITTAADVGSKFGPAANALSDAAPKVGMFSKVAGVLSKLAMPLAVATTLYGAGSAVTDKTKSTKEKAAGVGGAVGSGLGGWGGAAAGAAMGAPLAPVTFGLSVPIGALLGGVAGSMAGEKVGNVAGGAASKLIGSPRTANPIKPISPEIVNTSRVQPPQADANNLVRTQTSQAGKDTKIAQTDPTELLKISVDKMNQTLGQILATLREQNTLVATDGGKQIAMQQKLHRALKSNNFAGATPADGAGATFKAG